MFSLSFSVQKFRHSILGTPACCVVVQAPIPGRQAGIIVFSTHYSTSLYFEVSRLETKKREKEEKE